jgi:cell division protein FtsQ
MELKRTGKTDGRRLWPLMLTTVVALGVVIGIGLLANEYLYIREINFYGNRHLSAEDLSALTGCSANSGLFSLSTGEIYHRLRKSPWIKEAIVRKDLTGRMDVHLTETVAVGVLLAEDKASLIDREGARLEEIKKEPAYFLPVIRIDSEAGRDAYLEAAVLAGILYDKKISSQGGSIELSGARPEELSMKVDGLVVKIGTGEFAKKLEKLSFVRDEISKRDMKVEYVDLRFADKIVVKPLKHGEGDGGVKADNAASQKKSRYKQRGKKGTGGRVKENVG